MDNNIPVVEMTRCICGQYHPVSDCEVVVIRIVKGKNCDLNAKAVTTTGNNGVPTITPASSGPTGSIFPAALMPSEAHDTVKTVEVPRPPVSPEVAKMTPEELRKAESLHKLKQDPFAKLFFGNMIPNDHPDFERLGAKEIRRTTG